MFEEWSQLKGSARRGMTRAAEFFEQSGLRDAVSKMALLGVVGSKGKGTAAVYASAAIAASGESVGTITSPGVISNRDRVRLDGRFLPDSQYHELLRQVLETRSSLPPPTPESGYLSPSGLYMLGGLLTLARNDCRVAVVEAGVGGRSDELSLLPLDGLIVTKIFNEHAELIGPTLVDIAADKIGAASERTKFVVSSPQSPAVKRVIELACDKNSTEIIWLDSASIVSSNIPYPPGLNRLNAIAGVRAGSVLSELTFGSTPNVESLREVVGSVRYPGRLSVHRVGAREVVIDSPISRDGLVTALVFAKSRFGQLPDAVYVSVPSNKDFNGFVEELDEVATHKVFVNMPQSHLPFPGRSDWPWDWMDLPDLESRIGTGYSLIVGTATFTAHVLHLLGVESAEVFRSPRHT